MTDQYNDLVASGYDAVYGAMPKSPTLRRLWREHILGPDFPEQFEHISLFTMEEARRMITGLHLKRGDRLIDLACGAGGPGLLIARKTGANLFGLDLSRVGVATAAARAREVGLFGSAEFAVGSFAETGLRSESFDGAMSLDAIQYAPDKSAVMREAARILRHGARFVFATYELDPERAAQVATLAADPVEDYRPVLEKAGFVVEDYGETPNWWRMMSGAYQAIVDAQSALVEEMGPVAAGGLIAECTVTLQLHAYRRRMLAVAHKV